MDDSLWIPDRPMRFIDIGCGNGLLVYLLVKEGHIGKGIDIRRRNIWSRFQGSWFQRLFWDFNQLHHFIRIFMHIHVLYYNTVYVERSLETVERNWFGWGSSQARESFWKCRLDFGKSHRRINALDTCYCSAFKSELLASTMLFFRFFLKME